MHDEFELDLPSEEEQLSAIAQSVRFAKDFAVIVAVCNDAGLRDRLIQRLAASLPGLPGRTARIAKGDDSLVPYLQEAGSATYLNVIGMGDIVPAGTEGDEHPLVASLNANRNALPSLFGGVVILWLPAFLAAAIHRGAPDFFSIRSGLYRFAVSREDLQAQASELVGLPLAEARKLEPEVREGRISRLLGLIGEIGNAASAEEVIMIARLQSQLGYTYATGSFDHRASKFALEAWQLAEVLYQEVGDQTEQANMLLSQGDLHYQEGRNLDAIDAWNKADGLYADVGSELGLANILVRRGDHYYREGGIAQAIQAWKVAENLYQKSGDVLGKANLLHSLGKLYYREGRNHEALQAWRQAEQLYLEAKEPIGQAHVLQSRGDLHSSEGRSQEAMEAWNQAEALYHGAGVRTGLANVLQRRGDHLYFEGRNQDAMTAWNQAEKLYSQSGDLLGQANVISSRGDLEFLEGRNQEASRAWDQAEVLYQQVGSPLGMANLLQSRGRKALSIDQVDQARGFFGKAKAFYEQLNMALYVGEIHAYLWQTYPLDSPEAKHHRAEAERIWRELGREDLIPDYFPTE